MKLKRFKPNQWAGVLVMGVSLLFGFSILGVALLAVGVWVFIQK